jgi:hypothetical protein
MLREAASDSSSHHLHRYILVPKASFVDVTKPANGDR